MTKNKEEKKVNYKTVTREELVQKIKENNLGVKYYFHIWDDNTNKGYERLSHWLVGQPMLISGSTIYYDVDFDDVDDTKELERMMKNIQQNDVVVLKELQELTYLFSLDFVESLTKLRSLGVSLYIIDYNNENFIEIDINLLLIQILSETESSSGTTLFMEQFEKLSSKYYDSEL